MISSSFWAPLVKHGQGCMSLHSAGFGVLIVVSFILTALAGASSSVVMLPTQGWYEFQLDDTSLGLRRNATRGVQINADLGYVIRPVPFMRFLASSGESLYPMVIDMTRMGPNCHDSLFPYSCLSYNWEIEGAIASGWQDSSTHLTTVMNISVALAHDPLNTDRFGVGHQVVTYKDLRRGALDLNVLSHALAVATCPQTSAIEILSNEAMTWPGMELESIKSSPGPLKLSTKIFDGIGSTVPVKQPRVVIQCAGELEPPSGSDPIAADTNASMRWHFDQGFYPPFDLELDNEALPSWSSDYGSVGHGAAFGFIDTQRYLSNNTSNMTVSAAFWIQGYRYMRSSNNFTVCLVDARWMESEVWVMPLESAVLARHAVSVDKPDYSTSPETLIELTLDWLNFLNATSLGMGSFIALRIDTLCLFIADVLSRVPLNHGQWAENFDSPDGDWPWGMWDPNHDTHLENTTLSELRTNASGESYAMMEVAYYRNAYAYEFGATTVTTLSWAVLLVHLLIVILHVLVVIFHKGWSSGAWVQLGELVALALNSTPPQDTIMRNTGAGVNRWRTWLLRASVKEVEDENGVPSGKVELVLQEPGVETDDDHRLGRTTQADWKYG